MPLNLIALMQENKPILCHFPKIQVCRRNIFKSDTNMEKERSEGFKLKAVVAYSKRWILRNFEFSKTHCTLPETGCICVLYPAGDMNA